MICYPDDLSGLEPLVLTGTDLSVADLVSVARFRRRVWVAPAAHARMARCRAVVEMLLDQSIKVYGLTTGFGKLRDVVIERSQTAELQRNLIRSHAAGVGRPFPEEVVRAAMLLRANTLCRGNSGIRGEVVEQFVSLLNSDVYPYVPEQGSVGASGDLSPLSHLALVLIGDDEGAFLPWPQTPRKDAETPRPMRVANGPDDFQKMPQGDAFATVAAQQGWAFQPVVLQAKEGLALNNGTQFMAALGCLALHDASFALRQSELACALSLEGNFGVRGAFDPRIHAVRPQSHQPEVAARILDYGRGSEILDLWLNTAELHKARLKLHDAGGALLRLEDRLDRQGVAIPARLRRAREAVDTLRARIQRLLSRGDAKQQAELAALRQKPPRAQILALNELLTRPRQDATALLLELQGLTFPDGEERYQARAAVVAAVKALDDAVPETPPVQDDYSFRCAPQVLACAHRAMAHIEEVLTVEINAATDNPLIFPPDPAEAGGTPLAEIDPGAYADWLLAQPDAAERCAASVIGGGNFHGEPLAIAMDYLKIVMAEVGSISERRIAHLTDPNHSAGLPAFLVRDSGVNSGFMIPQYTAAALVSENKVLCHPASVDSVPTCANTEDHVSMGTIACRHAVQVVENVANIVAIELLAGAQALRFREPFHPGDRLKAVLDYLNDPERGDLAPLEQDQVMHPRFLRMRALMARPDFRALLLQR